MLCSLCLCSDLSNLNFTGRLRLELLRVEGFGRIGGGGKEREFRIPFVNLTLDLQSASRRRHFLTRRASSFTTNSLMLALDSPHNLTINCTLVLDDWLLIGAQEGTVLIDSSDVLVRIL